MRNEIENGSAAPGGARRQRAVRPPKKLAVLQKGGRKYNWYCESLGPKKTGTDLIPGFSIISFRRAVGTLSRSVSRSAVSKQQSA